MERLHMKTSAALAQAYEKYGTQIDAMFDALIAGEDQKVTTDDDVLRTGVRVYEREAAVRALQAARFAFQKALKNSN